MSQTEMPERYAPKPYLDRTVSTDSRRFGPAATIPNIVIHEWVPVETGTTLRVAPRSERAVTIGPRVPEIIGSFTVSIHTETQSPSSKVPKFVLEYMGAEPGDTLRFERVDRTRFRIERREGSE